MRQRAGVLSMPGVPAVEKARWKIVDSDSGDLDACSEGTSTSKQHVVWNIGSISKVAKELSGEGSGGQLDAVDFEGLHLIRMYRFLVCDQLQEVSIAHAEDVWQVLLNGKLALRKSHSWKDNNGRLAFEVYCPNGDKLPACVDMVWSHSRLVWSYALTVNGICVPAHWAKVRGDEQVIDVETVVVAMQPLFFSTQAAPQQAQPEGFAGQSMKSSAQDAGTDSTTEPSTPDADFDFDSELNFLMDDEERLAKAMSKHERKERQERRRSRMRTRSWSLSRSNTSSPSLASISEDDDESVKHAEDDDQSVKNAEEESSSVDECPLDIEVEVDENRIADVLERVVTGMPLEAYHHGMEIQYFSQTHKRWLPGTIRSTGLGEVYDVIVGPQNQRRGNVPLENIRVPFSIGDTIEYFLEEGHWVPAKVTKCSRHSVMTVMGYSICLTASGECFDRVPPERLRHHFPPGEEIWMYSRTTNTWTKVAVHAQDDVTDGAASEEMRPSNASLTERWTFVLVRQLHGGPSERVPSYLLRLKQPQKTAFQK